jgi:Protein of unknown function (DUF1275)
VDSYALLNFGVFASFMSGNTTSGGVQARRVKLGQAGHSLLPVPFFVLGILVGTLLVKADQRHQLHRLSGFVATMLTVATAAAYLAWPGWLSIMILSTAMGILNTLVAGRPAGQHMDCFPQRSRAWNSVSVSPRRVDLLLPALMLLVLPLGERAMIPTPDGLAPYPSTRRAADSRTSCFDSGCASPVIRTEHALH